MGRRSKNSYRIIFHTNRVGIWFGNHCFSAHVFVLCFILSFCFQIKPNGIEIYEKKKFMLLYINFFTFVLINMFSLRKYILINHSFIYKIMFGLLEEITTYPSLSKCSILIIYALLYFFQCLK